MWSFRRSFDHAFVRVPAKRVVGAFFEERVFEDSPKDEKTETARVRRPLLLLGLRERDRTREKQSPFRPRGKLTHDNSEIKRHFICRDESDQMLLSNFYF